MSDVCCMSWGQTSDIRHRTYHPSDIHAVQFYPWFKFSLLLFLGMVMYMYDNNMISSLKQKKRKFEQRIKLNHNIHITHQTSYIYHTSHVWHQTCDIRRVLSNICIWRHTYHTSDVLRQTCDIRCLTSDIRHQIRRPTSDIRHLISDVIHITHQTSSIWHQTSDN